MTGKGNRLPKTVHLEADVEKPGECGVDNGRLGNETVSIEARR